MAKCDHLKQVNFEVRPTGDVCQGCVEAGQRWVELRQCLVCGHVGCCDSSPNRHARAHFHATHHPVIQSAERGEDWRWCYIDEAYL